MLKKVFPALILSFTTSFMLFLYEPIIMYANNMNDFWFDFYIMIKPTLLLALIGFIAIVLIYTLIYVVSNFFKKESIYQYALIAGFALFVCFYIHSNFLAGFLPALNGDVINWKNTLPNIISILICLAILVIVIVCCKKNGKKRTIKYSCYIAGAFTLMLTASFVATILSKNALQHKEHIGVVSSDGIDQASTKENFMILLLDAVDSRTFNHLVTSKPEYEEIFKDFTYYPDTMSGYSFTRDSIPFIFSSEWNENKTEFVDYSTQAFDGSNFFKTLSEKGYSKNFYETELVWNSDKKFQFNNIHPEKQNSKITLFMKQELKYILFKILPYPIKKISKIESMNFNLVRSGNIFACDNTTIYKYLNNPISTEETKYFQFIHTEGGHTPFNMDENLNLINAEKGTYPQKLIASIKIVDKYLNRLKEANVYDNSIIVIMADHGFGYEESGRQNPILYIKGINDKHEKTVISDKQVSYVDLNGAFVDLLNGAKTKDLFAKYGHSDRKRRFLNNQYNREELMEEYEQTGKAWDNNTLTPTGREFNL